MKNEHTETVKITQNEYTWLKDFLIRTKLELERMTELAPSYSSSRLYYKEMAKLALNSNVRTEIR